MKIHENDTILLVLMPFWDPQIPPVGLAALKGFLRAHRFRVKTVDANVEAAFRDLYNRYFDSIRNYIPEEKRRHLLNIGIDVLRNHSMAYLNRLGNPGYEKTVGDILYNTFYCDIPGELIQELHSVMEAYFAELEIYILRLLEREKPAVLGLSVYSGTLPASLFAFKLTKERYPHITTVMGGGIFSSELALDSLNFDLFRENTPYIDKIIVGEGERLFLELLKGELPEEQKVFTLEDIGGETFDISAAEVPDFGDYDLQYYTQMANYTSRSCPFQCKFCVETVYWGKYRKKSGQQIFRELSHLYETYGHQLFLMCDSLLNPIAGDLSRAFVDSQLCLYWGGYLRADVKCTPENTLLWRKGGLYRARLGLESGSQRILDAMNKKITLEQVKNAVHNIANAGIKTTTMWVIGFPGETEEDFRQTLRLIEEMQNDIYEADCNPFWYFGGGQVNSADWSREKKTVPLYPGAENLLMLQTWLLDTEPARETRYDRVNRFIEHCRKLGIPNPYTLSEVRQADERWKRIHKNAVPSLLDLQDKNKYIDESKNTKNILYAENTQLLNESWDF